MGLPPIGYLYFIVFNPLTPLMMDALGVYYGQENMQLLCATTFLSYLFPISPSLQVKSSQHHVVVMHDSFVFSIVPFTLVCSNGSGSKVPFSFHYQYCFGYIFWGLFVLSCSQNNTNIHLNVNAKKLIKSLRLFISQQVLH